VIALAREGEYYHYNAIRVKVWYAITEVEQSVSLKKTVAELSLEKILACDFGRKI